RLRDGHRFTENLSSMGQTRRLAELRCLRWRVNLSSDEGLGKHAIDSPHFWNYRRRFMKYWEIIADNLSKADGREAVSQPWIAKGERSSLPTHIAAMESVSLCTQMKS